MDVESVRKAYSRWAHVYDLVFGRPFRRARREAIEMLAVGSGQRVLEVGVGTGLSLPEFPPHCSVFGVDISRPMLRRARPRAAAPGRGLVEADAGRLPFRDATFDAAFAPYVVSAVPDPAGMLREIVRVTRQGGPIVLLNHFVSEHPVVRSLERTVTRLTRRLLGFHADFDVDPVLHALGLAVVESRPVPPLRYWRALRLESLRSDAGGGRAAGGTA